MTPVRPSSFVGRALAGGTVGPCSFSASYLTWELTKGAGGAYTGTNHGFRWDSSDSATCRDLPIRMTAQLGTISRDRLSMQFCYEATDVTSAECNTWSRLVTEPLATLVPIESVSNGCGGTGWRALEKVQNYLGNTSVYWNSRDGLIFDPEAKRYKVDFSAACDLHDAGYAGAIVRDRLRGGIKDFRGWSRKQVDDKFLADMRMLCTRAIPRTAVFAVRNCRARGGNVSFGAQSRYAFVRTHGGGDSSTPTSPNPARNEPGTARTPELGDGAPQTDAVHSISISSPSSASPVTPRIVCAGCPAPPVTSSIAAVIVSYSVGVVV